MLTFDSSYLQCLKFDIADSIRYLFSWVFLDEEKKMVEEVFSNAIDCLSDEDKKLPQVCFNILLIGNIT